MRRLAPGALRGGGVLAPLLIGLLTVWIAFSSASSPNGDARGSVETSFFQDRVVAANNLFHTGVRRTRPAPDQALTRRLQDLYATYGDAPMIRAIRPEGPRAPGLMAAFEDAGVTEDLGCRPTDNPQTCNVTEQASCSQTEQQSCSSTEQGSCADTEASTCSVTEQSSCTSTETSDCPVTEQSSCSPTENHQTCGVTQQPSCALTENPSMCSVQTASECQPTEQLLVCAVTEQQTCGETETPECQVTEQESCASTEDPNGCQVTQQPSCETTEQSSCEATEQSSCGETETGGCEVTEQESCRETDSSACSDTEQRVCSGTQAGSGCDPTGAFVCSTQSGMCEQYTWSLGCQFTHTECWPTSPAVCSFTANNGTCSGTPTWDLQCANQQTYGPACIDCQTLESEYGIFFFTLNDLMINDNRGIGSPPNEGKIIMKTDNQLGGYYVPDQTEDAKVTLTIEFVADAVPILGLWPWMDPNWWSCPPFTWPQINFDQQGCDNFFAAFISVNIKLRDLADPAPYAVNSEEGDNLDPDLGYFEIIRGALHDKGDKAYLGGANGKFIQASVIPELDGLVPSLWGMEHAFKYQVVLEFFPSDRYAGDNYLFEISIGEARQEAASTPQCRLWQPARGSGPNGGTWSPASSDTQEEYGPLVAYGRRYYNTIIAAPVGVELFDDFTPDADSDPDTIVVYEDPYNEFDNTPPGATGFIADTAGWEEVEIVSAQDIAPGKKEVTLKLLTSGLDLQLEYKRGYADDPRRQAPGGRGAVLVILAAGGHTYQYPPYMNAELDAALSEAYYESRYVDTVGISVPIHVFPLNGQFPLSLVESSDMVQQRLQAWAPPAALSYDKTLYSTILVNSVVHREIKGGEHVTGVGFTSFPNQKQVYAGLYFANVAALTHTPILDWENRAEWVACHEFMHFFDAQDDDLLGADHLVDYRPAPICLMNNSKSAADEPGYANGYYLMYQDGTPESHHYYPVREVQFP